MAHDDAPPASVAVFGASGRVGSLIVRTALARGFHVRAFVRKASSLSLRDERLRVFEGSVDDLAAVRAAVAGTGGVVVALGPRREDPKPFTAKATATILRAMGDAGVTRIVCLTGAMIGDGYPNRGSFYERMRGRYVRSAPEIAKDRDEQERLVTRSALDWTVVKPPRLTDKPARGGVKAGTDLTLGMFSSLGREDLAAFLVDQVTDRRHLRKCVFVLG